MLWVDCSTYYGPDRRLANGLRIHERRRENIAGYPPALESALRQLRMYVLEAEGPLALRVFADRARALAVLAESQNETGVADILCRLAESLQRSSDSDRREFIYDQLDRLYGAMHTLH